MLRLTATPPLPPQPPLPEAAASTSAGGTSAPGSPPQAFVFSGGGTAARYGAGVVPVAEVAARGFLIAEADELERIGSEPFAVAGDRLPRVWVAKAVIGCVSTAVPLRSGGTFGCYERLSMRFNPWMELSIIQLR